MKKKTRAELTRISIVLDFFFFPKKKKEKKRRADRVISTESLFRKGKGALETSPVHWNAGCGAEATISG